MVLAIKAICVHHDISSSSATIAADGLAALQEATWTETSKASLRQHYDLVNQIQNAIRGLPISILTRHVKGHQDATGGLLDKWEKLNVKMDALAKAFHAMIHTSADLPITLDPTQCVAKILGVPVVKDVRRAIKQHVAKGKIIPYWITKFGWTEETAGLVDWTGRGKALTQTSLALQRFVLQHSTGFSGTMKNVCNTSRFDLRHARAAHGKKRKATFCFAMRPTRLKQRRR